MSTQCDAQQQRGVITQLLLDFETCPGVTLPFASRKPVVLPFNSFTPGVTNDQNPVETITGTRNRREPHKGFADIQPSMELPMDSNIEGLFCKAAIGNPVSYLSGPNAMTGTPTITWSSGDYVLSAAQAYLTAEETFLIVYRDGDTIVTRSVVADAIDPTTEGAKWVDPDPADVTDAPVLAIIAGATVLSSSSVVITNNAFVISSDVAIAVGDVILHENGATARITAITQAWDGSTVEGTVVGTGYVDAVADVGNEAVIIRGARFTHEFSTPDTARLPSFALVAGYLDLAVPYWDIFAGCKVNETALSIDAGGADQTVSTKNMMAESRTRVYQPYDAESHIAATPGTLSISSGVATATSSHTNSALGDWVVYEKDGIFYRVKITTRTSATSWVVRRKDGTTPADITGAVVVAIYPDAYKATNRAAAHFPLNKITATLNNVTGRLTSVSFDLMNNLDGDTYTFTGNGDREGFNEGFADVTGDITARLTDTTIMNIGIDNAIVPMSLTFGASNSDDTMTWSVPSTKHNENAPEVTGPGGTVYTTSFVSFGEGQAPTITATLTNEWSAY